MHISFVLSVLTLSVIGCVNSNPSLYLLEPKPLNELSSFSSDLRIGVQQVRLPDYARDARFVEQQKDGSLVHVEEHRWAEAPTRALTRALSMNLHELTGRPVFGEPFPDNFRPTVHVSVDFLEFDSTRSGEVRMRGHFIVRKGIDGEPELERFAVRKKVEGESFGDVKNAVAVAIAELATSIAKRFS
ncbi:MAG: PqiC family protein [Myxococcota bacterium]